MSLLKAASFDGALLLLSDSEEEVQGILNRWFVISISVSCS